MKRTYVSGLFAVVVAIAALAYTPLVSPVAADGNGNGNCQNVPSARQLKEWLQAAPLVTTAPLGKPGVPLTAGGLFDGKRMWAAVVNRDGEICASSTSTDDPTNVWPGSQAIAKAKAYAANAFSLDDFALSTARLYTFTQPGHSLWSLGQSNLFNSNLLVAPGERGDKNQIAGGLIFFGGGVPIYYNGKIVGGLGISGDTSCTDHEIAKRVRHLAGLDPAGGPLADDIVYETSVFAHPVCLNTYRNGVFIGNEAPATYPKQ